MKSAKRVPASATGASALGKRKTWPKSAAGSFTFAPPVFGIVKQSHGHLLVFSEGSRSRTGGMQRALAAVARYLEEPFARVVPFDKTLSTSS